MTINIIYDHRGRAARNSEGPVELRVTNNRKSVYVNTGVMARRSEFCNGEIIGRADVIEINDYLGMLARKAMGIVSAMIADGEVIDGKEIRRRLFSVADRKRRANRDMIDWFEEQVPLLGLKDGTVRHYVSLVKKLNRYKRMMAWEDLTVENICRFDGWLHAQPVRHGGQSRYMSDAGVYNYHKYFKALINRAVLFEKIETNPYAKLRGKFRRGESDTVDFLTKAEMDAVEALRPEKGAMLRKSRDLFVFQMHTGLSYSDTQTFDFSQYRKVRGKWVNIGRRNKTGVQYIVQLDDVCLEILGRYGMALPKLNNFKYNQCLKEIGRMAGIFKPLHSHMARHSFATYMVARGAKVENVSKMLGHTNISQTLKYARVLPESVLDDFDKVRE